MSITIKDCLQLPSLSLGNVIAGHKGLNNIVNTVSVVEFDNYDDNFRTANELLITAFYSIKDDVSAQCIAIEEFKRSGDVGMVLFYSDMILKSISPKVIETANNLDFPIILLPGDNMGLRYSDVINDVMEAIFINRKTSNFFVNNTIERISQLSESNRNITSVLKFASDYAKAAFFLCDNSLNLIAASYWPSTNKIDFELVKSVFKNDDNLKFSIVDSLITNYSYEYHKVPFLDKNGTSLNLFAINRNNRLNSTVLNQIIEVIQLFAVIWNYNLNLSIKEALIPALIQGNLELINSIAVDQNINLSAINAIMFIDVNAEVSEASSLAISKQLVNKIQLIFQGNCNNIIVDIFGKHIVILGSYNKSLAFDNILLDELSNELKKLKYKNYFAFFTDLNIRIEARNVYIKYCDNIEIASKIYPYTTFFSSTEIEFALKCKNILNSVNNEKQHYFELLSPIMEDNEEDLLLTLTTYFLDANSESKKTAELLFVHRNTIQYRLSKIKTMLNCEINKLPMSYEVYLAVALYRITSFQRP